MAGNLTSILKILNEHHDWHKRVTAAPISTLRGHDLAYRRDWDKTSENMRRKFGVDWDVVFGKTDKSKREQKLIDVIFEIAMRAHSIGLCIMSNEERAEYVRKQLKDLGFNTVARGSSWGVLTDGEGDA